MAVAHQELMAVYTYIDASIVYDGRVDVGGVIASGTITFDVANSSIFVGSLVKIDGINYRVITVTSLTSVDILDPPADGVFATYEVLHNTFKTFFPEDVSYQVLADSRVYEATSQNGTIVIPDYASRVRIGFKIEAEAKLMPPSDENGAVYRNTGSATPVRVRASGGFGIANSRFQDPVDQVEEEALNDGTKYMYTGVRIIPVNTFGTNYDRFRLFSNRPFPLRIEQIALTVDSHLRN
jgi:hypothetical protein